MSAIEDDVYKAFCKLFTKRFMIWRHPYEGMFKHQLLFLLEGRKEDKKGGRTQDEIRGEKNGSQKAREGFLVNDHGWTLPLLSLHPETPLQWQKWYPKTKRMQRCQKHFGTGEANVKKVTYLLELRKLNLKSVARDFLGGPVVKTLYFQCRRTRFDPWVGFLHSCW